MGRPVSISMDASEQFEAEFAELMKRSPIVVELTMIEAWALACAVQEASLSPHFGGAPAAVAQQSARWLFALLVEPGTVMEQVVALNWHEADNDQ